MLTAFYTSYEQSSHREGLSFSIITQQVTSRYGISFQISLARGIFPQYLGGSPSLGGGIGKLRAKGLGKVPTTLPRAPSSSERPPHAQK